MPKKDTSKCTILWKKTQLIICRGAAGQWGPLLMDDISAGGTPKGRIAGKQ
jgi:hypothetical protein